MTARQSSDYQQRYSTQMTGYPPQSQSPPPDRTPSAQSSNSRSPLYAPLAHPTPPHLAHSRYSSADLYALQPESGGGGGSEGQPQTASTNLLPQQNNSPYRDHHEEEDSDSSDEEEGGGFGTYRDFSQVEKNRQSSRLPPLNPRMSTSGTMSTLQNPGGGSTYQLKEQISSTAKFEGGAYETVAMPKISGDWSRGEGLNEKNDRKFAKSRRKRQEMKGFVGGTWDKAKRKWKIVVPAVLLFLLGLILILYFCIPRTPTITFRDQKVPSVVFTSTDENPYITSTDPVSYSFRGNLIFALDATSSYVPVKYSSFGISVKLRETGDEIGRTTWSDGEISIPGKQVTSYEFPILFSGNYSSDSDQTFSIMKSSCAHIYASTYREPLNLTVEVTSSIMGVIGEGKREATVTNVVCPIQWSGSAN